MKNFTISSNEYLSKNIQGYYHQDYTTFGTAGNPDFINHLKNSFDNTTPTILNKSRDELISILNSDLIQIRLNHPIINLTVCVIPRAKKENNYTRNQKLFKTTTSSVVEQISGLQNGTNYIIRHTDTKTTHLNRSGYGGTGLMPYMGITKNTCTISNEVVGKNIILIDDIYTSGVNIDEDAIQALLDKGAKNVLFYAVGKTYKG